jgi:hypothetical protein
MDTSSVERLTIVRIRERNKLGNPAAETGLS